MSGKGVVRSIKNYTKGYTEVQRKVREATSNDPWGPSSTLMNEIAQFTYNQHTFVEAMDMIDKRLNDKGKNWRHIFKALVLLDYCLHVGSDDVVKYARENIRVVNALQEFHYIDDGGNDVGASIRQTAKDISTLLSDESRLDEERRQRLSMRERMTGSNSHMNYDAKGNNVPNGTRSKAKGHRIEQEDQELQRALEESRRMAEEDKRRRHGEFDDSEDDLAKAIRLSELEAREKDQKEKLFDVNSNSSFSSMSQSPVLSASKNPYRQQQQLASPRLQWAESLPSQSQNQTAVSPFAHMQQQEQIGWMQPSKLTDMQVPSPISTSPRLAYQNTGVSNNPYHQLLNQQSPPFNNPYQSPFGGVTQPLQTQVTGLPQQSHTTDVSPFQQPLVTGSFPQPQITSQSNNPFISKPQNTMSSATFGSPVSTTTAFNWPS